MAKEAAKKKAAKKPASGVGALARQLILEGKSNADVLAAIQKKFPDSKATSGTVGWYRNDLKAQGKKVKDSRDITAGQKKAGKKVVAKKKAAKAEETEELEIIEEAETEESLT